MATALVPVPVGDVAVAVSVTVARLIYIWKEVYTITCTSPSSRQHTSKALTLNPVSARQVHLPNKGSFRCLPDVIVSEVLLAVFLRGFLHTCHPHHPLFLSLIHHPL